MFLLSQCVDQGKDLILIAGTDNVLLPSQPLTDVSGIRLNELRDSHLFFFSKQVCVLDHSNCVIDWVRSFVRLID